MARSRLAVRAAAAAAALLAAPLPARADRIVANFNSGWRFMLGDDPAYQACTPATVAEFPVDLTDVQLTGLAGVPASDAASCRAQCNCSCQAWQWSPSQGCWVGLLQALGPSNWVSNVSGWVGGGRFGPAAPATPQTAGPAWPGYNDSATFAPVDLPHDYVSYGTPVYSPDVTLQQHGYLPLSVGWYRKIFTLPPEAAGALVRLHFDGVYRSSDVFLDGHWVGHHESGYTQFDLWLHNATPRGLAVGPGAPHTLAVRTDPVTFSELWSYEGAGITRDVSLVIVTSNVTIAPCGVWPRYTVYYPVAAPAGPYGPQTAAVSLAPTTDVANGGADAVSVVLTTTVVGPSGAVVAQVASAPTLLPPGGWARLQQDVPLADAALWFPAQSPGDAPRPLYTLVSTLAAAPPAGGPAVAVDAVNTTFGLRDAVFDPAAGLLVNGFPVKITGMSMHGDLGGSGAAVPGNLVAFRVQRLMETGGNAWRTAHQPPAPRLLEETDRRGVLVWEENRFLRAHAQFVADAADMVRADRHHPSVVLWSLCNENGCLESPGMEGALAPAVAGASAARAYKAAMDALDGTRPITANTHALITQPGTILDALDVMGVTYDYGAYDALHAARPFTPVMGGESASCVSDRGFSRADNGTAGVVGSYDPLGCTGPAWAAAAERAWVSGNFAWAGADYGGESEWPAVSSHYGVVDLCGLDKPTARWYRAAWGGPRTGPGGAPAGNASELFAFPAWDGAGFAPGEGVSIVAFTTAPLAQLEVNGAVVGGGNVSVPPFGYAQWDGVPYAPGGYTVTTFANDTGGAWRVAATFTSTTPGPTAALALEVAWAGSGAGGALVTDGADAVLVTVAALDAQGRVATADTGPGATNVTFAIDSGPGVVHGSCSGFPADHVSLRAPHRQLYAGLARVTVRSTYAAAPGGGDVVLTASAPGLAPVTLRLPTTPPPQSAPPRL